MRPLHFLPAAAALAAALLAGACGGTVTAGTGATLPSSGVVSDKAIDFRRIPSLQISGIADKRTVVVRDASAWAALWAEHAGDRAPLPAVDFSRDMVIGVFVGPGPTACATTAVESVTQRAAPDRIEVGYRVTDPGPAAICIAAWINQHALVVVPQSSLTVQAVALK